MTFKIKIIFLVLFVLPIVVAAKTDVLEHSKESTFTVQKSDYQTIVDYVNANSSINNSHSYPANSENYYGASAYYSNFDIRGGSYSSSFSSGEEVIIEALARVLLPAKFPSPVVNEKYRVGYKTFSGSTTTDTMRFYCASIDPLVFTAIIPSVVSHQMDSADYQIVVDYVNANLSNSHIYPIASENYYGASAFFKNFDVRSEKFNNTFSSADEAIAEAISKVLLPTLYADVVEKSIFSVGYISYSNVSVQDSMTFVCVSESPLAFHRITTSDGANSNFQNLSFGSDSTFDIITWNIEHFPKNGDVTMAKVKEAIVALNPEVIAFQEIDDTLKFRKMVSELDDYTAIIGNYSYAPMCYIYKTDSVIVNSTDQLFADDNTNFPREPLVLDVSYYGERFIIINNHLKCCGDGTLDLDNNNDEENRRFNAIKKLKGYIDNNWSDQNVVAVGDYNDVLEDEKEDNIFSPFIDDEVNYKFVDEYVSFGNSEGWSYPSWPSHLDHILITNELFGRSSAEVIQLDSHITWGVYDRDMSDHRPVGLKIKFQVKPTSLKKR